MTRYWTTHWQNRLWRDEVNPGRRPIKSSGSNSYKKRGVAVGDVVYVVSIRNGRLLLGGRMTVGKILSRAQAVKLLGTDELFDATDWIIAEEASGTPLDLRRQLDPEVTRKLSFISGGGTKPLFFVEGTDRLDVQATRGVRELTPTSARFLDEIIELTDGRPPSDHLLNVNSQMLRENRASELIFAEEVRRGQAYAEGAVTRVTVNRYERDPRARQACINHYGARCIVCCLDFAASYGDVMSGFIHVHHVVPLSTIGSEYELDPVRDLRPVCPNCHAVIHRRETPYSVDEVRDLYRHRGTH